MYVPRRLFFNPTELQSMQDMVFGHRDTVGRIPDKLAGPWSEVPWSRGPVVPWSVVCLFTAASSIWFIGPFIVSLFGPFVHLQSYIHPSEGGFTEYSRIHHTPPHFILRYAPSLLLSSVSSFTTLSVKQQRVFISSRSHEARRVREHMRVDGRNIRGSASWTSTATSSRRRLSFSSPPTSPGCPRTWCGWR